jgi:hypothetical protein
LDEIHYIREEKDEFKKFDKTKWTYLILAGKIKTLFKIRPYNKLETICWLVYDFYKLCGAVHFFHDIICG